MPEIRFQIAWPDGSEEQCYSPSLVVKSYFSENTEYTLTDFVERSRKALTIASDRVKAKYGMACSLALGQLQHIETVAQQQNTVPDPKVRLIRFIE